jgi:hypothetical protein
MEVFIALLFLFRYKNYYSKSQPTLKYVQRETVLLKQDTDRDFRDGIEKETEKVIKDPNQSLSNSSLRQTRIISALTICNSQNFYFQYAHNE